MATTFITEEAKINDAKEQLKLLGSYKALASVANDPEKTKALIEVGADVNDKNLDVGLTVLLYSVYHHSNIEVVKLLIEAGADLNLGDRFFRTTALMNAIDDSNPALAKLLIEAGADVKATDSSRKTVSMHAMEVKPSPNPEIVNLLIEAGFEEDFLQSLTIEREETMICKNNTLTHSLGIREISKLAQN